MKKIIIKLHAEMLWLTALTLGKIIKSLFSNNTLCGWRSDIIRKVVVLNAVHGLNMFEE